jgi:hypothetical protein
LLTAARNLLIGVVSAATDAKVINAGAKGPRPALPYVTVRLTTLGGDRYGPAERVDGLTGGDAPQATMRQRREAIVSYQGYGSEAYGWLDDLHAELDSPASLTVQGTEGVAALLHTPVTDLSQLLDTAEETRSQLELRLRHQRTTTPAEQVELLGAQVTAQLERYSGDPDTLSANFALDESGDLTTPP